MFHVGDVIFFGQPFAFILLCEEKNFRCDYCLSLCESAQIACSKCSSVFYCSRKCKDDSAPIHQVECVALQKGPLLPLTRLMVRVIIRITSEPQYSENVVGRTRKWTDLMDHYDEIIHDAGSMLAFEKIFCQLEFVLQRDLDVKEMLSTYGRILINSFAIQDEFLRPIGRAVFLGASVFDHSCTPNAVFYFSGKNIFIRAIKDISGDDAVKCVFICYLDEMETTVNRKKHLLNNYYFECNCSRCTRQDQLFSGILMDEEAHVKPLCDSLYECNLDASVIYCNLTCLWKRGIRPKAGDPKVLISLHCHDENLLQRRIQVMSHIQQMKYSLLSLESVAAICLMDALSIYQQDIDLMLALTQKYTLYYGLHHPRVALKLFQVATLSSDCYLKHKLLLQARNICIICTSPSLVSLVDCAIRESQEQLKAQIKVKNSKCKWVPNKYSNNIHFNNSSNSNYYYNNWHGQGAVTHSAHTSSSQNYSTSTGSITYGGSSKSSSSPFELYTRTRGAFSRYF